MWKSEKQIVLTTFMFIFFVSGTAIAQAKNDTNQISQRKLKIEYKFLDAVLLRRLDLELPEYDRFEFLGSGRVFINDKTDDLLGQFDVGADVNQHNPISPIQQNAKCGELARKAFDEHKGFTIEGVSNFMPGPGYKTCFFLDVITDCFIFP